MEVSREAMELSLLWWVVEVEAERIADRTVRRLAIHFQWGKFGDGIGHLLSPL